MAIQPSQQPRAAQTVTAVGASGTPYTFELNLIGASYRVRSGVYMFCKLAQNGDWNVIYIGETDSFWRRLTSELRNHHKWPNIVAHGATHILTLHVPGALRLRESIETDLRRSHNPPCNDQ